MFSSDNGKKYTKAEAIEKIFNIKLKGKENGKREEQKTELSNASNSEREEELERRGRQTNDGRGDSTEGQGEVESNHPQTFEQALETAKDILEEGLRETAKDIGADLREESISVMRGTEPQWLFSSSYVGAWAKHPIMAEAIRKAREVLSNAQNQETAKEDVKPTQEIVNNKKENTAFAEEKGEQHELRENNDGISKGYGSRVYTSGNQFAETRDGEESSVQPYTEGVSTALPIPSGRSKKTRQRAESERLIEIAKENGDYIPSNELYHEGRFGNRKLGVSGESTVFISDNGEVYTKEKNPYAKDSQKKDTSPEDAILEHVVHNLLFPTDPYHFVGISEFAGDVRIVLQQKGVKAECNATEAEIEDIIAELDNEQQKQNTDISKLNVNRNDKERNQEGGESTGEEVSGKFVGEQMGTDAPTTDGRIRTEGTEGTSGSRPSGNEPTGNTGGTGESRRTAEEDGNVRIGSERRVQTIPDRGVRVQQHGERERGELVEGDTGGTDNAVLYRTAESGEELNNIKNDEDTRNLFVSLQNKKGKEYNDTINELTKRVIQGRASIRGEFAESERGTCSEIQLAAAIIAADRGGIPNTDRKGSEDKSRIRQNVEQGIEDYAKNNGAWFDEKHELLKNSRIYCKLNNLINKTVKLRHQVSNG